MSASCAPAVASAPTGSLTLLALTDPAADGSRDATFEVQHTCADGQPFAFKLTVEIHPDTACPYRKVRFELDRIEGETLDASMALAAAYMQRAREALCGVLTKAEQDGVDLSLPLTMSAQDTPRIPAVCV